jgi:hypothetical protein
MIATAVTIQDWSFKNCQDYLVELKVSISGTIMSLRLANDIDEGSMDGQVLLLTSKARDARKKALMVRQVH